METPIVVAKAPRTSSRVKSNAALRGRGSQDCVCPAACSAFLNRVLGNPAHGKQFMIFAIRVDERFAVLAFYVFDLAQDYGMRSVYRYRVNPAIEN